MSYDSGLLFLQDLFYTHLVSSCTYTTTTTNASDNFHGQRVFELWAFLLDFSWCLFVEFIILIFCTFHLWEKMLMWCWDCQPHHSHFLVLTLWGHEFYCDIFNCTALDQVLYTMGQIVSKWQESFLPWKENYLIVKEKLNNCHSLFQGLICVCRLQMY